MVVEKSNHFTFLYHLVFNLRYNFDGQNVWTCADWAYGLNDMFQSMGLQYWQTKVVDVGNLQIHAVVEATFGGQRQYYDPWFVAPFLYGFQVFPPLPSR